MNDYEIQKIRDTAFCSGYNTAVSKYEKQNKELREENAELKKQLEELPDKWCRNKDDYCPHLAELEKENAELKEKLNFSTQYYKGEKAREHLIKAKELLKRWVELYKPKLEGYPITPIQVDTEQFLSEVEK